MSDKQLISIVLTDKDALTVVVPIEPHISDYIDRPAPVRVGDVIPVRGTDQHRRVCAVESCRISRNGEWLEPYTEEHGWKITLGTDWLGGTREEAEAIYERYGCEESLAFDYEGGEVGARAHLLGPRNGTYRHVGIGDTVYHDSNGVQVRRMSCA